MSLKTRILLILIVASILSAATTGGVLIFLIELSDQVLMGNDGRATFTVFATAIYLLSGLPILMLLAFLLNKMVILPTVEREVFETENVMLTKQLYHAQKMEAIGRLAGSIAHDFNNLLTVIDGFASLIIRNPKAEETGQNAQEVVEAARRASFITRKLLSFSHKEDNEAIVLDLNTTMADTEKMLSRLIGGKIQIVTRFSTEPIFVKADPVRLGQVLMNLAVNSRDAMPNGGRIIIQSALKMVENGKRSKPDNFPEAIYARMSVRDTGEGIDSEKLEKIFEPFFTTKQIGKGTGLGLSIVKGIINESEGFIDIKSKPGSGTTFSIYLPLADSEKDALTFNISETEAKAENECLPEKTHNKPDAATILLVEDDPMIRTLVAQTLDLQNYKVLLADDGWEAAQLARKFDGEIDLLFTDVVMPGLGGAELAVAVKELYPEIKLLFMSGYSRAQVTEEGVPPEAPLLEKPFASGEVVATICDLLTSKTS